MLLAGGFSGVRVLMTQSSGTKWLDTKIEGILKLVMVKDIGVPIVQLRLYGEDAIGS